MAFQLSLAALFAALLFFSSCGAIFAKNAQKSQPTKPSKHGEVYRAKSEIDSLIYKLTLDLNTFNEKKTLATVMQKDAEKLARVAEEEIALLKPVQHLLEKFAKGTLRVDISAVWLDQVVKYDCELRRLDPLCLCLFAENPVVRFSPSFVLNKI